MRLYKIDATHHHTEIDVNSPEGFIMNTCFENSDIKDGGYVVNRRSKDDMEVKLVLIVDEEKYTIDEVLERCDDDLSSLDEFINWFVKAYPGCKCIITIDDGCTTIDINDKTGEDTNEK